MELLAMRMVNKESEELIAFVPLCIMMIPGIFGDEETMSKYNEYVNSEEFITNIATIFGDEADINNIMDIARIDLRTTDVTMQEAIDIFNQLQSDFSDGSKRPEEDK